jgi:hypothetical protein
VLELGSNSSSDCSPADDDAGSSDEASDSDVCEECGETDGDIRICKGCNRFLHEIGSLDSLGMQTIDNDTFNVRFDFSPWENITVSTEYAYQLNSTKVSTKESIQKTNNHASGGFGQIEYKREDLFWQPAISYRYAIQGNGFDSMSPGFSTWGTWFQGEITGEWVLDNANLRTHVGRLVLTPEESLTLNLLYYNFTFDNARAFDLVSANYGNEVNFLTDWQVSESMSLSV